MAKQVNYLYFLQLRPSLNNLTKRNIKIGITNNLKHRLRAYHTVDRSLHYLGYKRYNSRKAVELAESQLHKRFDHLNVPEQGVEWFKPSLELLLYMVKIGVTPKPIDVLFMIIGIIWQTQ